MSKYIDADKLKAEIERLQGLLKSPLCECLTDDYKAGGTKQLNLLRSFIDSLQQEQPNDVCAEIKEYYGEELPFEDEKTKAAYHFFSAGCSFELRKIEEETKDYIIASLDNYKKGMKMGYQKALLALKDGKIENSPIMTEFLTKLLGSGFGFGPNLSIMQEQPEVDLEEEYKTWWNSISGKINVEHIMEWYIHETARHFYELGTKARKDESTK